MQVYENGVLRDETAEETAAREAAEEAAANAPKPVPTSVTNSDWRVGLLLWKRPDGTSRFDEVQAKIIDARNSNTDQGRIVWQRWEYANDVYRTELMALRDQFGFTAAEVDESLQRAEAVGAQASQVIA